MHPLVQKIVSLQRRLIWRQRAAAACRIGGAVIAAALVLGFADYVVRYSDRGLRIMATAALATVTAWAVYRWWYRQSRGRLVPIQVARRVESRFPQLHDSLASALEFLQQSEDDPKAGSSQLRRLVVAEAETAVEELPLYEIIDRRPLHRALGWLAVPLAAAALCLAIDARAVGTALSRLAAPLGSTEWPRQHHLAFLAVPERLAAGQAFEVELIDTAGQLPDEVRIEYRTTDDRRRQFHSEPMTRAGDIMLARRENVRQPFSFRATGGDDDTMPWQKVEVIEPPQLEALEITVHPPAYTGLPALPAERHLQVLAGTRIEMHGVVDKPITAARIQLNDGRAIEATVRAEPAGNQSNAFNIAPNKWRAHKTGPYRLELTDSDGLAVVVGQWNLRVEQDSPPTVVWQRPSDDLYVTREASVPIELLVKDNLAIHRVELVYERSDRSEAEREREPAEPPIELYRGPVAPATASKDPATGSGDIRTVEYDWDLARLELPVGAQITLHAQAEDYRPNIGRAVGPRHISIITAEELEARLAERQAQIARQLERALAAQRITREDVRRLEIDQREVGLKVDNHDALRAAEMNQRRVGRMLVDPIEGVPALVGSMLAELDMNRVAGGELRELLDRLAAALQQLSAGPLEIAERELAVADKAISASAPQEADALSRSLTAAGAAQDGVIATLEQLVNELSDKADYRRLARQLTELRADQIAHQESARAKIGLETLPLKVDELTRSQRAELSKAAAGQTALAGRLEKIEQGMDELARELAEEESDSAGTLADAVDLARRLAIGGKMQETVRGFSENRVGQALARETEIAADLDQVLDILRQRDERRLEQLVDKLRDAEQQLAGLRKQLAALREQIAQAEQKPPGAANEQHLQQLGKQQQALRRNIEQLARQLNRMQAADAAQSTQSAADRLETKDAKEQRPSPRQQVEQAEQDLEKAEEQLAQRRQQAEDDLALELVRRFQSELGEMVEQQKRVLKKTATLDRERANNEPITTTQSAALTDLISEERRLADKSREHSELLFGLAAVRISLEDAERRLIAAAELLDRKVTGTPTQEAERNALVRLEAMLQAFAQTANEAGQNQQPRAGPGAGAGGEQPQRRPTFELLEVKMLRMLQADLHERTKVYRQKIAGITRPLDDRQRTALERKAQELATEQARLAELVENMLTRDNEE